MPYGAHNAFTMPVNLSFWGREENKTVVMDHMKKYGFKLGPIPQSKYYEILLIVFLLKWNRNY